MHLYPKIPINTQAVAVPRQIPTIFKMANGAPKKPTNDVNLFWIQLTKAYQKGVDAMLYITKYELFSYKSLFL